jgi:serine/threonine protein kinase
MCQIIRKELLPQNKSDKTAYERELRNLSLLSHLKHPNIIELFCCYSYRGFHNLIFPMVDFGDLRKLLKAEERPIQFTDTALILAITDFSSALDAMHNFFAKAVDIQLTGCHHDLAPRNILVHKDSLLLADFGLSKFKDITQDSPTQFKGSRGFYIAPECQDVDGTL